MIQYFVLDTSVSSTWILSDEKDAYAEAVQDVVDSGRTAAPIVPYIWAVESANVIAKAKRRKRITSAQAHNAFEALKWLEVIFDEMPPQQAFESSWRFARKFNLSAYDAMYIELALRRKLPLATLDARLQQAARNEGVTLFLRNEKPDNGGP